MIRWSFQFAHGWEPGGAEREAERLDESDELVATLGDDPGHVGERVDLAGLDLGLGRDQLAGERAFDRRANGCCLHVLEAVDEIERDGVEQRELFLDRDGEVGGCLEALAGVSEKLIGWNALLVAHGA